MLFIELYTYTCKFGEVMVVAMKGGEVTKKHAKFHKLDAEGIHFDSGSSRPVEKFHQHEIRTPHFQQLTAPT